MSSISPTNSHSAEIAENYRKKEEEKERIKTQNEKEIQTLKDSYSTEKASLEDRFEKAIAYDKASYYENIRDQKRELRRAEDDFARRKNEHLGKKEDQLRHEQTATELDGQRKIDETRSHYATAVAFEQKSGMDNQNVARKHYKNNVQALTKENEQKIGALYAQKQSEQEFASARNKEAIDQMHKHYQDNQLDTQSKYSAQLKIDQNKIQGDLNKRRLQNAQLMGEYANRQNDPFYQMVRPDAEISENRDAFKLRIRVPEHERGNLKVQVNGQELQITGTRSNNEKAEISPGNWITTSTHQNYTERYPLSVPVDAKSVVAKEDGEWMEYEILKFGPNHRQFALEQKIEADKRDRTVTTIDFPKTLPSATVIAKRGRPGNGTIT